MAVKPRRPSTVGLTTAAARTVLAPLEGTGGRAEAIAGRLGDAIRIGLLLDGERLPAETELAAQFGVSTVTLREALTLLREQGLVVTRRGRRGGSFVRAPADRREPLQRFSVTGLRDLGDQRGALMGAAARLAAERAQPEETQGLREQVERLRTAGTASERRRASHGLTIAVAAAAQSPRLTHEEARLRSEVGDLLDVVLDDVEHDALTRELVEAIAGGEAERARELAERHVAWETERLIERRLALDDLAGGGPAGAQLDGVAEEVERVFASLDVLGARFAGVVADAGGEPRREDLQALRPTIFALIETHPLIAGAGVVTAPDLLADAPRWLEWWFTGAQGAPEALRVNLDREAPDFYDYTTLDWYAAPERTLQPRMSGPYVDYVCTNQYALTLSVPVMAAHGMLGVAAADVLVARLERSVVPALAAIGRQVALTTAEGRVIASTSASVVPGQRIGLAERAARPITPARSWLLVDL